MTDITINLTPPLDGVQSEIGTFEWGQWQPFINLPSSSGGKITAGVTLSGLPPGLMIQVWIPAQTIGGTAYKEADSQPFPWEQPTFIDNITLEQVTPPNGNGEPGPITYPSIAKAVVPVLIGAALLHFLK